MINNFTNLQDIHLFLKKNIANNSHIVIISDNNVLKLPFYKEIILFLQSLQILMHELYIPPGESTKNRETKEFIEDELCKLGCDRQTILIALGGGVIGDLVGFVASTFMRGIEYIQIPTTLLAMVDSSIGGKVAVNTPYGKNIIGAFWPATEVIIYPKFLQTLSHNELKNGFMEIVKIALVVDKDFFFSLKKFPTDFSNTIFLNDIIKHAIKLKESIVQTDPKDTGKRAILNFGHTLGHALEKITNYKMAHGIAVAYGSLFAAKLSKYLGHLSDDLYQQIEQFYKTWQISINDLKKFSAEDLLNIMKYDKKNQQNTIKMILLDNIGSAFQSSGSGLEFGICQVFAQISDQSD